MSSVDINVKECRIHHFIFSNKMVSFRLHTICICATILLLVCHCNGGIKVPVEKTPERKSRAVIFPASTTIGILIAIAMPLDLPHQNVIFSYNFEANYNMPFLGKDIIPGPLERLDLVDNDSRDLKCGLTNDTCSTSSTEKPRRKKKKKKKKHKKRPKRTMDLDKLITRKQFYKILIRHFKGAGFKGRECLLRLICEVNLHSIEVFNGVTGSIVHVMFSPTTSEDEGLHEDYYIAEYDGVNGDCTRYEEICEDSILDMFSKDFLIRPKQMVPKP